RSARTVASVRLAWLVSRTSAVRTVVVARWATRRGSLMLRPRALLTPWPPLPLRQSCDEVAPAGRGGVPGAVGLPGAPVPCRGAWRRRDTAGAVPGAARVVVGHRRRGRRVRRA